MENQSYQKPETTLMHIPNNTANDVATEFINLQFSRVDDKFHKNVVDQNGYATMYKSSPNPIIRYTALFIEWLIFSAPFGKLLIMLLMVFIFNSFMCAVTLEFLFSSFFKKPVYLFDAFASLAVMILKMIMINTFTGKTQIMAIASADKMMTK